MTPLFVSFLQATGLVVYIILLTSFFNLVTPSFGSVNSQVYAPILLLLLFVVSAVISGLLVLGRAGFLFWEKIQKVLYTNWIDDMVGAFLFLSYHSYHLQKPYLNLQLKFSINSAKHSYTTYI
jgi:hypothetical protein